MVHVVNFVYFSLITLMCELFQTKNYAVLLICPSVLCELYVFVQLFAQSRMRQIAPFSVAQILRY